MSLRDICKKFVDQITAALDGQEPDNRDVPARIVWVVYSMHKMQPRIRSIHATQESAMAASNDAWGDDICPYEVQP